jgi:hypothetical protein
MVSVRHNAHVGYADCQYGELLGRGPHQIEAEGFRDQSPGIKQSQREKCSEGAWTVLSISDHRLGGQNARQQSVVLARRVPKVPERHAERKRG